MVHRREREVALLVYGSCSRGSGPLPCRCSTAPRPSRRSSTTSGPFVSKRTSSRMKNSASGPKYAVSAMPVPLEVLLRLLGDVARVAAVGLAGDRVLHEAVDVHRRVLAERVHDRGRRVGHQDHVGFLDLLEPADRGSVEAEAVDERVRFSSCEGTREVLHEAWQVAEPQVDELDALVLDLLQDVFGGPHRAVSLNRLRDGRVGECHRRDHVGSDATAGVVSVK